MAIRYSNGSGVIIDKELEKPIGDMRYQMMETAKTTYTAARWWGDLSLKKEKRLGSYILEFEDGRKGECVISASSTASSRGTRYHYSFFGRGSLGRRL